MAALFVGLLQFLREIMIATASLRIGLEHVPGVGAQAPGDEAPSTRSSDRRGG